MNRHLLLLFLSFLSFYSLGCDDTSEEIDKTPTDTLNRNLHIYLCFGQSNMEGSAQIEPQDQTEDERFQMIQPMDCDNLGRSKGEWYTATPPLSQCYTGLSPADYFGKTMVANLPDSISIVIINVAVGGCDIRLFDKDKYQDYTEMYTDQGTWFKDKVDAYGGAPYYTLMSLAKNAQKKGVIKGILLHQGETNTGNQLWPSYVKKVYNDMLEDLSLEASEVPLLAGEVVHEDQGGICATMNEIINKLPEQVPTAHVIPSSGCTVQEDNVHFDSEGVRELDKRYARKMLSLLGYEMNTTKL
ncbi:sialate O-acetylesterase [Sediminitomix flava]|uniref:Sialate O-acetylesterase domain-containing protein n=1 Tax=Sediminitomix flava TaxID=379075 RepID=A0A315ZC50_SEDFL|nr:sialate O-acetylesterase [Sediminitomix flava]PWJ43156.1 protein of unknown function (DUF303) [Sediminitomix flava]